MLGGTKKNRLLKIFAIAALLMSNPTSVGITRSTPSVRHMVVVSDGIAIRVALRFFISLS